MEIVEDELEGYPGSACLVKDDDGNFFVVSTIASHFSNNIETKAFRADPLGNVVDWAEVAGGGNMTRTEVIDCLDRGDLVTFDLEPYFDEEWYPEEDWEDWYRDDESLGGY